MPPNAPIQLEQFGTRFQCSRKAKKIFNVLDFNSTSNNDTINQCCVGGLLKNYDPLFYGGSFWCWLRETVPTHPIISAMTALFELCSPKLSGSEFIIPINFK